MILYIFIWCFFRTFHRAISGRYPGIPLLCTLIAGHSSHPILPEEFVSCPHWVIVGSRGLPAIRIIRDNWTPSTSYTVVQQWHKTKAIWGPSFSRCLDSTIQPQQIQVCPEAPSSRRPQKRWWPFLRWCLCPVHQGESCAVLPYWLQFVCNILRDCKNKFWLTFLVACPIVIHCRRMLPNVSKYADLHRMFTLHLCNIPSKKRRCLWKTTKSDRNLLTSSRGRAMLLGAPGGEV